MNSPQDTSAQEATGEAVVCNCGYAPDDACHDGFEPPYIVRDVLTPVPRHRFTPRTETQDSAVEGRLRAIEGDTNG